MTPIQSALASHPVLKFVTVRNAVLITAAFMTFKAQANSDFKDVKAETLTLGQQVKDIDSRLTVTREANQRKVDKDTYDRDIRDLRDGQNRLQLSIDNLTRIVIDTRETGHR